MWCVPRSVAAPLLATAVPQPFTAQRCRSATEKKILEDLFSSVLSPFEKYHPSGNLKFYNLDISKSLKLRILVKKIFLISLKLNFTPNTLGCEGLIQEVRNVSFDSVYDDLVTAESVTKTPPWYSPLRLNPVHFDSI